MKKILIGIFILCGLHACQSMNGIGKDSLHPNQPPERYYKMTQQPFVYDPRIDTLAVYITVNDLTQNGRPEVRQLYSFMRFSADGVAYISENYEQYPTPEDFERMPYGQFCPYRIKDGIIKMEMYNHLIKRFDYWTGRFFQEGFVFDAYKGRGWSAGKGKLIPALYFKKTQVRLTGKVRFPG